MKKIYCLLGSVLLSLSSGFAQEHHLRNSKWFSYGTQLQFQPYSTPQATANPFSGFVTASVCDPNGNPLIVVKDSGAIWAKGQDIGYISFDRYNVTIIPKPKHSDRYYIVASGVNTGLQCVEVDLTTLTLINPETPLEDLNGNPIFSSPGGSGVASTVHANGIDYWITAFANDTLMSYQLTKNGINTIPISASTLPSSEADASLKIKISPKSSYDNKKHIAIVNFYNGTSLKDFNDETGEITDSYSNMNYALEQRNLNNFNNIIQSVDAEFSADGSILYCVDDINNYGSVYAIQGSGNIIPTGEYGGFINSQRGSDDSVYFLDGYGNLSQAQTNSTNYPYNLGISLFYYGSFYQWGYLPQLVSFNDCLASPAMIPTFSPTYICRGTTSYSLPTTSNNGITGTWLPAFNNMATTTYTFTSDQGQCAAETTNLTVVVNDQNTIPTFDSYPSYVPTSLCIGSSYTFPTTSTNQITGTWSSNFNNQTTTTYTFTPNAGQCGTTTTHTITINQKVTPTFNPIAPICSGDSFTRSSSSTNGISGSWSPERNFTETTTYTFTPFSAYCATATSMTVIVNPKATPTFDSIAPICAGSTLTLPIKSTNGIVGTWSPAVNNTATTTYTFTPAGQCGPATTMTVTVKPTIPVFDTIATVFDGSTGLPSYTQLPNISSNGINGWWDSGSLSADGILSFTFTPYTSQQCANKVVLSSLSTSNQNTLVAQDDYYTGNLYGLRMSSVFQNDLIDPVVANDLTVALMDTAPFVINPDDGTFYMPTNVPSGYFDVRYRIYHSSCPDNFAIAHIIFNRYGMDRKANESDSLASGNDLTDRITAFPNPSTGIFNIDLTNTKEDYDTIRVFNMLGALVYENKFNSKTLVQFDLTNMPTGCYMAKVSGNSGNSSFQLIKQ